MFEMALASGTPFVLTNAVRYLHRDDAITGDLLDSAGRLQPMGSFDPQPNAQAWLKDAKSMRQVAEDVARYAGEPGLATRLYESPLPLVERCVVDPHEDLGWQRAKVPELEVIGLSGDPQKILDERCRGGLVHRWPRPNQDLLNQITDRLNTELRIIESFGFATYFLMVADVVDLIKGLKIRVQARGSGAGSLVNYCLGVSNVDPVENDLLFERFLGLKRETLPDIDIDVESARRHDVYYAVTRRYGSHRVALLSMQNQYKTRGALRDTGLALGLPNEKIDRTAKSLWRLNVSEISEALKSRPELAELAREVDADPRLRVLLNQSKRLYRLPRYIAMHPCGVILSDQHLLSLTPTQPSGLGIPMSQFDKDDIDDMGLLKLDILGVRMQSTIAYTLDEIERRHGDRVDVETIAFDDEPTFDQIRSTHNLGVFQIESRGQRELVGTMQPDSFADLVADISLYRPGPMKSNMITPFVEAKLGFRSPQCLHPRFRQTLGDSYGVVIYHEHVIRILADCMGITLGEADGVRRRLGKHHDDVEVEFRTRAAQRSDEHGRRLFTDAYIDRIWETMKSFGSFGFCKAHAAAVAVTTYQSAWLKTHYPVEFMAGIMEHGPGMYPKRLLLTEAKRMGIPIYGIDVNTSTDHYRVDEGAQGAGIRMPFIEIKGISGTEVRRLIEGQPYSSVLDVIQRGRVSRVTMQRLAGIGGLDSVSRGSSRGTILAQVRHLTARPIATPCEDQEALVDEDGVSTIVFPEVPDVDPLSAELDILGIDVSGHALDPWRGLLDEIGVTPVDQLLNLRNNSRVVVAGIRVSAMTSPSKSKKRVVFISLDDGTGVADCAFFDDAQHRVGPDLFRTRLLAVKGITRRTGAKGISINATEAWDFTRAVSQDTSHDI
jgi:error-prone DNA polymerase